jgi:hypothetical protein
MHAEHDRESKSNTWNWDNVFNDSTEFINVYLVESSNIDRENIVFIRGGEIYWQSNQTKLCIGQIKLEFERKFNVALRVVYGRILMRCWLGNNTALWSHSRSDYTLDNSTISMLKWRSILLRTQKCQALATYIFMGIWIEHYDGAAWYFSQF